MRYNVGEVEMNANKEGYIRTLRDEGKLESTIKSNYQFLKRVQIFENIIEKNLCTASTEEIAMFFRYLKASSIDTLKTYYQMIVSYFFYCASIGIEEVNLDFRKVITPHSLENILEKDLMYNKYLTEVEFEQFLDRFEDKRDILLYSLIFEGFLDINFNTISSLKIKDVDFRSGTCNGRIVSRRLLKLIKQAKKEKVIHTYSTFNNGEDLLIESDYLIRERQGYAEREGIEVGKLFNGKSMNKCSIINRITKLKNEFEVEGITPTTLSVSGIINRALSHLDLEDKQLRVSFVHYCVTKEGVGKVMAYKYYKIMVEAFLPRLKKEQEKNENESNNSN